MPAFLPPRHYSVGSKPMPLKKPPDPDQYVEMRRSTDLAGKHCSALQQCYLQLPMKIILQNVNLVMVLCCSTGKSLSVPHLMAPGLASNPELTHLKDEYSPNYSSKSTTLIMLNPDKTAALGENIAQRPRGATWSTNVRPNASSFGPKHRLGTKSNSSRESVQSSCSEYVDMKSGHGAESGGTYVDMVPSGHHQRAGSIGSASGRLRKSNHSALDGNQGAKLTSKLSPPRNVISTTMSPAGRAAQSYESQFDNLSGMLIIG